MARYHGNGSVTAGAAKTAIMLRASASVRPRLTYFAASVAGGVPGTDQSSRIALKQGTAADGTPGSTPTPVKNDQADAAAASTLAIGFSVEPTYAAQPYWDFGMNPRTTFQWQAYDKDSEIVVPAGVANGVGLQMVEVGGAVNTFYGTFEFRE